MLQIAPTVFVALCAMGSPNGPALGNSAPQVADPYVVKEGLTISFRMRGGRTPLAIDPIQAMLAKGVAVSPKEGDTIALPGGGTAAWKKVVADKDGNVEAGSYLFATVRLAIADTMLLQAAGHGMVYVNGEPHAGDPYGYGYLRVPVKLHAGENELLFAGAGRGPIHAKVVPLHSRAMLDTGDLTMPDILTTDRGTLPGAIVVVNGSDKPLNGARLSVRAGELVVETAVPTIPPLSVRKVRCDIPVPKFFQKGDLEARVDLIAGDPVDSVQVTLRVKDPMEVHKRTFISDIDGSVQYYAVNPAQKPDPGNMLVLSTHGAGVEALGQAQAYASHDSWTLVAPTNRRPYGFDWEDWGRLDALEVLAIAEKTIAHDPQRVVLTGHSMGGHGAWHLGLTFPDKFAAFGPSAGWSSFFSYGGSQRFGSEGDMPKILGRAMAASDTMSLVRNSLWEAVYILHGGADDNVPVSEAHTMRDALAAFNPRMQYHEQPGVGHWWGAEQGPGWGTACVDWKPMFEMFQKARLPLDGDVKEIEFTTANPAVSGKCHWVTIEQQIHPMEFSTVNLRREGDDVVGTTKNVAALRFDIRPLGRMPSKVVLDGITPTVAGGGAGMEPSTLIAIFSAGKWVCEVSHEVAGKNSHRGGPFKQAFTRDMVFVYGTKGTRQENAWAFAKARFDAEQWQYRGNGAVDVIADVSLDTKPPRNVILYGNADTNKAWGKVLKGCPISVTRKAVSVGSKTFAGDDLGCAFLYPKAGDPDGLVGVIAGTGLPGLHSVERLPVFSAGVALPDWLVVGVDAFEKGIGGVRGAGYFGNDWRVETGDCAWGAGK